MNEQEGQKPSQIITCQLGVGGHVKRNASNGNTNVLINNREITKEELWMLKGGVLNSVGLFWIVLRFLNMQDQCCSYKCLQSAGVPCEGETHYWVSEDGTYKEEGQNIAKGKIWDKVSLHTEARSHACFTQFILLHLNNCANTLFTD